MHEQYCYVRVELCGHTCHKKWSLSQQMRGQAVLSPLAAERRRRRRKAPLLALVSLAESPACVHIMRVFAFVFVFGVRTCMCTCACVHVVYVYTHTHTLHLACYGRELEHVHRLTVHRGIVGHVDHHGDPAPASPVALAHQVVLEQAGQLAVPVRHQLLLSFPAVNK